MIAETFRDASHFAKLIFILFSVFAGFLIFMLLGVLIAVPVFGLDLSHFAEAIDMSNAENVGLLKFLQSFYSLGLFAFPAVVASFLYQGSLGKYLKLNSKPGLKLSIIAVLIIVAVIPSIQFLVELFSNIPLPSFLQEFFEKMEDDAQEVQKAFLVMDSFSAYFVNIVVIAIIPAICEEFFFRGILMQLFRDWFKNIHVAIWFSAFLFGIIHVQVSLVVPITLLGALFGYLYHWSKNLWVPILVHFLNNSITITIAYLNGDIAKEIESTGTSAGGFAPVLISLVLVTGLILVFYRIEKEKSLN